MGNTLSMRLHLRVFVIGLSLISAGCNVVPVNPGSIGPGNSSNEALIAPVNLRYHSPVTYVVDSRINANFPVVDGGAVDSYSIAPDLPSGLSLNPITGVLSGTPTAVAAVTDYTVTATNRAGSAAATLRIEIQNVGETTAMVMRDFKDAGCVILGLFEKEIEDVASYFEFVQNANCKGLLRTVDTWYGPTDYSHVAQSVAALKGRLGARKIRLGAFIGEVVYLKHAYSDVNGQPLNASQMCFRDYLSGRINEVFGAGTCVPNLASLAYQAFVIGEITHLLDLGFQDFMFGQTQLQDPLRAAPGLLKKLRSIAQSKNIAAIFGAQTNDDLNEGYLRSFDYITGGVGLQADGSIQDADCNSLFSTSVVPRMKFCWAMVWRDIFRSKANNVLVYLDWFGDQRDETHIFARLSASQRSTALTNMYQTMRAKDVGYAFTIRAPLGLTRNVDGSFNGCHGFDQRIMSPINYSGPGHCNDHSAIQSLLLGLQTPESN